MTEDGSSFWRYRDGDVGFAVVSLPLHLPAELARRLTRSELEVCAGLLRGERNAAIARRRGTTEHTVANQVQAIFGKLRVSSRNELAALVATHRREREHGG